jgi:hypothetical protein
MYYTTHRTVVVDWCLACDLGWFDPGKLEVWRANGKAEAVEPVRFVAARGSDPLRCPGCEAPTVRMGSIGSSLAWSCDRCQGFLQHFRPGERFEETLGFAGRVLSEVARLLRPPL